ncbi:MAG TPA: DUF294 nucleotidyltransferase-like domain-containing protein, partial [Hyphomicrobiaceae bacterium]|nr:DUF294 nucleotidyltransferase-like domain-containing protein [Hyphomicrobiaceae bacterium]
VRITGRHTATGDALATAEAFVKLVPHLRERGIRTVAEAETACRTLAEQDARTQGGLMVPDATPQSVPADLARLDVFAFRHRVSDVMSKPPATMPGTATVREMIRHLLDAGLSSVFVTLDGGRSGIVTERDALRVIRDHDVAAFDRPISTIAKSPLHAVADDDHVYRAIGRMERLKIRHLAVLNAAGEIVGALTPRNLLRNRATTVIAIGDRIAVADTAEQLGACWAEIPAMVVNLLREDVDARTIAGIVSSEICAITRRAAELSEREMAKAGRGAPPVPYAVLVLGSAGRGESLLAADQDNAIVFEAGEPGGPEDKWFEAMATHMARILDEVGIVYCKGGVMAKNAEWRHSLAGWTAVIDGWVRRQNPQDLLNVDIFFDAVPVHGDMALGRAVLGAAFDRARATPDFLKMMTELARQWTSPVGLLGGFQKTDGRLDLKKFGLMPVFTAARVLALRHGVADRSTAARLHGVHARKIGAPETIGNILAAHELFMRTVLEQQIADGGAGIPLSPRVDVDRLDKTKKRDLKDGFDAVSEVIDLVAEGRLT